MKNFTEAYKKSRDNINKAYREHHKSVEEECNHIYEQGYSDGYADGAEKSWRDDRWQTADMLKADEKFKEGFKIAYNILAEFYVNPIVLEAVNKEAHIKEVFSKYDAEQFFDVVDNWRANI